MKLKVKRFLKFLPIAILSDYTVLDPWNGTVRNLGEFSLYGDNQIITFE